MMSDRMKNCSFLRELIGADLSRYFIYGTIPLPGSSSGKFGQIGLNVNEMLKRFFGLK